MLRLIVSYRDTRLARLEARLRARAMGCREDSEKRRNVMVISSTSRIVKQQNEKQDARNELYAIWIEMSKE